MAEKTFMQQLAELEARMDKLDELIFEQKIKIFALGIEVDEIKRGLDDIQLSQE